MSRTKTKVFMSIGDVVTALKEEFPEVSVSKIRFLEAAGLIDPERTASGYRKFYGNDVARLKYILRLQRDQFVPLKVIRQRLEHFDPADDPSMPSDGERTIPPEEELGEMATGLSLGFDELVSSSGLDAQGIRELQEYGLIDAHPIDDGAVRYDEDDLMVAKLAREFGKYGIEPRHLKMYRNFVERETALFEQVLLPRGRANRDGRRQVTLSLAELAKLSKRLKHVLLARVLRDQLRG